MDDTQQALRAALRRASDDLPDNPRRYDQMSARVQRHRRRLAATVGTAAVGVAVLVFGVLVVPSTGHDTTQLQPAGPTFAVPTHSWQVGEPAKSALQSGVLGFTSDGCPFLDQGSERILLAFPAGAHGVRDQTGTRSVVDSDRRIYGTDGETAHYGGGGLQKKPVQDPCPGHPDLIEYWSVQEPPTSRRLPADPTASTSSTITCPEPSGGPGPPETRSDGLLVPGGAVAARLCPGQPRGAATVPPDPKLTGITLHRDISQLVYVLNDLNPYGRDNCEPGVGPVYDLVLAYPHDKQVVVSFESYGCGIARSGDRRADERERGDRTDATRRQPQQPEVRGQHDAGETVGKASACSGEQNPSGVGGEAAPQRHRRDRRPLDGARHARLAQISTSRSMIRSGSQAPSSKLLSTTTVRSRLG